MLQNLMSYIRLKNLGRVVRVCCLILHMSLMENLNFVIVDGHFHCSLS
jgi:hypothetical protein